MSLTSPITTLTLGQDAPMPNRSSAAPSSDLPLLDHTAPVCFFGAIFGSGPITSLTSRSTQTLPILAVRTFRNLDSLSTSSRSTAGSTGSTPSLDTTRKSHALRSND